jgi:hypothetical protein
LVQSFIKWPNTLETSSLSEVTLLSAKRKAQSVKRKAQSVKRKALLSVKLKAQSLEPD